MATSKLADLVAIYEQQLDGYRRLLALASEQQQCVETSNYPVLVELLERRAQVAAEVAELSAGVRALCQGISRELGLAEVNLSSLRQKLSDQLLDPLAEVLSEITTIIEQIQALDRESEAQLGQILGLLRGQMPERERGRVAARAYQQAAKAAAPDQQAPK